MVILTFTVTFFLAIVYASAGNSAANVDKAVLHRASLSNPHLRSNAVDTLAGQSRAAKAGAWRRAQSLSWNVKGRADGIQFELMALMDGRPIYYITNNVNAAISTAADLIRNTPPYNLNGSGLTVGVWDAGSALSTHQEFDTRLSVMDGAESHYHSTHVAGTIGASGVSPSALGMAPSVAIDSYDWDSQESEMASRAASYPAEANTIYLSNHSYGIATGWTIGDYSGTYGYHWFGTWLDREADGFGQYSDLTVAYDSLCYAAPYYLPFKSAGNDRGDGAPPEGETFYYYDEDEWQSKSYNSSTDPYGDAWDNGGFDTIPHRGNAKNIMTVGAVSDAVRLGQRSLSDAIIASFSSWGPADDGRIKPDIVANGINLYSPVDDSDTSYGTYSGTSMAAPDAAGSAILLVQLYGQLFPGQAMRASTLKALIIHATDDLGNPGPDYSFGWGLMNVKTAADIITDQNEYPADSKIFEGLLDAGNPDDSFSFIWNGETPIRATLCWTDPPATAISGLDDPSPRLINDLDVRIVGPNGIDVYYPYVLDPLNPANSATTGDNILDNVEQVCIISPNQPGLYTVIVDYKGTLTDGQQHYSLIITSQYHTPSPEGTIELDREVYSCADPVEVELRDGDLVGNITQNVMLYTSGSDIETLTLYEDDFCGGIFTGTITTSSGAVIPEDGTLQIADGQTIIAEYQDANDGTGSPAAPNDIASLDCEPPTILNIQVSNITSSAAIVTFETNEPATTVITYGLTCEEPNAFIEDPALSTAHSFQLVYLSPETDYYFALTATDNLGNETIDANEGLCYQFTTIAEPSGIRVPEDYPTIQAAIDAAVDGNNIIVADGTYTDAGNRDIDFKGKAITITSENGPVNCIINCDGSLSNPHRGFNFHSGEDSNSILSGFTIINGFGPEAELRGVIGPDYFPAGGAILCKGSSPTIENCVFRNNEADKRTNKFGRGGAIACGTSNAITRNCIFEDNEAYEGGGLYTDSGYILVTGCTFTGNITEGDGGGLQSYESSPKIESSIFDDNFADNYGGGINCDGGGAKITNCVIINNTAFCSGIGKGIGGGMHLSTHPGGHMSVTNCTVAYNSDESGCGGIVTGVVGTIDITNCIIWGNAGAQLNVHDVGVVTYCDIQNGFTGEGNINSDPNFVSATDFHLTAGSPCIDAGADYALSGFPPRDLEDRPRPLDGDANQTYVTDMGAYEYWDQPAGPFIALDAYKINVFAFLNETCSKVLSIRNGWTGTLNWQIIEDCNWLEASPMSGDSTGEIGEITLTVDANGLPKGNYSCNMTILDPNATNSPMVILVKLRAGARLVPEEYPTIQDAIDASEDTDIIKVADGTHAGPGNRAIDYQGKAITVMSENGPDNCTIDCQSQARAFYFHNNESTDSILKGFTIQNGRVYEEERGGGINCVRSSPTITNCIITNCHSYMGGGGIHFLNSFGRIVNSIIARCTGGNKGGGLYSDGCNPEIINCTVYGNSANLGGGYYSRDGYGKVKNCIFWNNVDEIDAPYSKLPTVTYSDVKGGFTGVGNINLNPLFVDSPGNDFHISIGSPCIDAGDPNSSGLGETDIDGDQRVINSRIDMGADEFDYISPIIEIFPKQIIFTAFAGDPDPEPQTLYIFNIGSGILNWQITEDCNWLEVIPTTGASNGQTDMNEVTLSVDVNGLDTGGYAYELNAICNEAINSPRTIPVYLSVGNTINVPSDSATIQEAIDASSDGMFIIVAPGTYTGDGNRDLDFKGKAITVQSTNPYDQVAVAATVINSQGTSTDYHRGFYFHSGEGPDSIVSGLTIINGYIGGDGNGGGIYCAGSSNPTIKYCTFRNNYAHRGGGAGVKNATISHCTFRNNNAYWLGGGLLCEGNATIKHCVFSSNDSFAITVRYSTSLISNCIIWNNYGYYEADIYLESGALTVVHSDVEGGEAGVWKNSQTLNWHESNIDANPKFVDMMNYNFNLQWDSPCINAGDPNYAPEPNDFDIHGEPRVMNGRIDIGPDEVDGTPSDFTRNGIVDLDDLNILMQAWLSETGTGNWNEMCDLVSDDQITFQDFAEFALDWLWQARWYEP